jgi:hypothetical protein
MTKLFKMPIVTVEQAELARFGERWLNNGGRLSRMQPQSSMQFGGLFDAAVAASLSTMLGGIPVVQHGPIRAKAPTEDCVEVGGVTISDGITPQTFDVGYRPDGLRFAFDSKTLNDSNSLLKNWQNMLNDLLAEATNLHSQFKSALISFMVIIPTPCFIEPQRSRIIEGLERLAGRTKVEDPVYMAEAISLVIWNPKDGQIENDVPARESPLRLERFAEQVETIYASRYTEAAMIHKDKPPYQIEEIGQTRQLKVFICHSSEDKPEVSELYSKLKQYKGIQPWLDEIDLIPGHDWDLEIRRAVKSADVILVCLSRGSVTKKGYVQKEIKYALDVADEQPEGAIFIIPLRLEECEVPDRLSRWHWVNYFEAQGYGKLLRALQTRADAFGITLPAPSEVNNKPASEPITVNLGIFTPNNQHQIHVGLTRRYDSDASEHWLIEFILKTRVGGGFVTRVDVHVPVGSKNHHSADELSKLGLNEKQIAYILGPILERAINLKSSTVVSEDEELEAFLLRFLEMTRTRTVF